MAIYGLKKVLVPPQRLDELDTLLRRHGMSLHPLHDATEGDIHILRVTGRRTVDKPLHGH